MHPVLCYKVTKSHWAPRERLLLEKPFSNQGIINLRSAGRPASLVPLPTNKAAWRQTHGTWPEREGSEFWYTQERMVAVMTVSLRDLASSILNNY